MRRLVSLFIVVLTGSLLAAGCTLPDKAPQGGAPRTPLPLATEEPIGAPGTDLTSKEELQKLIQQMTGTQGKPEELPAMMQATMALMIEEMRLLNLGSGNTRNSRLGERMDDIGGRMGEMSQMTPRFEQLPPETRQDVQSKMERLSRGMRSLHDRAGEMTAEDRKATLDNLVIATEQMSVVMTYLNQDPGKSDAQKQQEFKDNVASLNEALDKVEKNLK